jgi:hypothetical protein
MVVAAQHSEGKGAGPGKGVKERFLLNGVHLEGADIVLGHPQDPLLIETDLADAFLARWNTTAVGAGVALDLMVREFLI